MVTDQEKQSTTTLNPIPFALSFGGEKRFARHRLALMVGMLDLPMSKITLIACFAVEVMPDFGDIGEESFHGARSERSILTVVGGITNALEHQIVHFVFGMALGVLQAALATVFDMPDHAVYRQGNA
jgi:hypothetical protein